MGKAMKNKMTKGSVCQNRSSKAERLKSLWFVKFFTIPTAALPVGWWYSRFTGEDSSSKSTSKSGMEFEASSLCPVPFQAIMHEGGVGSRMFCVGA